MKKILFLIHDLGPGGAEKVLINLVNNMNTSEFAITVMTIFDVGINRKYLKKNIRYLTCFKKAFRGNSHIMKILSPERLHNLFINEHYDIEVAYLEGPCARIVSGCKNRDTKLVAWIHIEHQNVNRLSRSFRNYQETEKCYNRFDKIVCVSETVKKDFLSLINLKAPICVLYNTNEYSKILRLSKETVDRNLFINKDFKLVAVGKLLPNKGFDRLLSIINQLRKETYGIHLYILGVGPEEKKLKKYTEDHNLTNYVDFLGYQDNPYKYVSKCDLFVCSSYREGFSTAATEALMVGTPVCTVSVSGMTEMLGENNEYGVVTENNDKSLFEGIKCLLDDKTLLNYYRTKAFERGKMFNTESTVDAVEKMLLML